MHRISWIAATVGSSLFASASLAAFTLSLQPSAQPATGTNRTAYDLFARNDADPSDGVNLQGVSFTATAFGSTRFRFASFDDGAGFIVDPWNFGAGAQQSTIIDLSASNLRIGARTAAQHAMVEYPGDGTPYLTADEVANGLTAFSADYAVLSSSLSVPANTGPGARFARVVVSGANPSFTFSGWFGGEVGPASFATWFVCHCGGPVINSITPNPVNVVFGQIVADGAPFSTTVNATDMDGDLLGITLSSDPNVSNVTITPRPNGDFLVTGLVNYAANGSTIQLVVTATDGSGGTDVKVLSIVVTPEPSTWCLLAAGLMRRRRH